MGSDGMKMARRNCTLWPKTRLFRVCGGVGILVCGIVLVTEVLCGFNLMFLVTEYSGEGKFT